MKPWFHSRVIFAGIVLMGLMATMVLLGLRVGNETNNNKVSVVMSYDDVLTLARSGGNSEEQCLTRLKEMGVAAIILTDDDQSFSASTAEEVEHAGLGLILAPTGTMTVETLNDWKTTLQATYPLYLSMGGTVAGLEDSGMTVGLVEDHQQYEHNPIPGFDSLTSSNTMARVFYLYPEYAARYGAYGYDGAQEIENIFYRAVTDRNARVLWMTPFVSAETGEVVGNLDEYAHVLQELEQRIGEHSITLGDSFSIVMPYSPNRALLLLAYLGIAAGGILLLESVVPLKRWIGYALYGAAAMVTAAGWWLVPLLMQKGMAFGASVIFPCLAAKWLVFRVKQHPVGRGAEAVFGEVAFCSLTSLAITLLGAAFIGGILSSSVYELVIQSFSGVKASQALPLLFGLFITARELIFQPGEPLRGQLLNGAKAVRRSGRLLLPVCAVILVLGVVVFVLGTGDSGVLRGATPVLRFRNWLENLLPIRPRLKEFLIAWPALTVGVYLAGRAGRGWAAPFLFLACLGFADVTNTFCHIRASVLISTQRTLLGVLIGLVLGMAAILVLKALFQFRNSRGSKPKT